VDRDPFEAETLGVEEEFQLLDAETLALTSRAGDLLAHTADPGVVGELPLSQVETVTPVCGSLAEVRQQVGRLRGVAADAAVAGGLRLASCGTAPLAEWRVQRDNGDPRYDVVRAGVGHLVREQLIAGLHVHVGVADPERAVAVVDRVRDWLPVLLALSASSPYWSGADSGFASWRSVHWRRWPVSGPPPVTGSVAAYDAEVAGLIAAGLLERPTQVYWDVRRSVRFPTVEFRVADAAQTVEEVVLLAGLFRALTRAALVSHDAGEPLRATPDRSLAAAGWVAARQGLGGRLVDPRGAAGGGPGLATVPAAEAVAALLDHVRPVLGEDRAEVEGLLGALLAGGGGAQRQRAAAAGGAGPRGAAELVVAETVRGVPRAGRPRVVTLAAPLDARERALVAERPPHHGS